MPGDSGRRRGPSKGDLRERAILDAAEDQLVSGGLDTMTVETIASAAGISRGTFYFYFGSRNDVLAALVRRAVTALSAQVGAAGLELDPAAALSHSIGRTAQMWAEHGRVMRVAVELSPSVPAVREIWDTAVGAIATITRTIAEQAGVPAGPGPTEATAVSAALVHMTERVFYAASLDDTLDRAGETLTFLWLRCLGLDQPVQPIPAAQRP